MSWDLKFPEPIAVPHGKPLVTLRDAGDYITSLPLKVPSGPAWEAAMHVLIQAADHSGPVEFARLGMMQALHPKSERAYYSAKKDPVWRTTRKLARDR
jgi:hypothetical protein